MKLTQSWLGYLDRSYQQIKSSCIARLVSNNPEITDHNESNLLIIILDMFAGIAEMLNYYIDMMGREAFMGVAKRYSSMVRLCYMIDYPIHANVPSTVTELFYLVDNSGNPFYTTQIVTIPKGTIISDQNGTKFNTIVDGQIIPGQAGVYIDASQYQEVAGEELDTTTGNALQQVLLPADYVDGSLILFIDGEPWVLYRSLGLMKSTTRGFIVRVLEDGNTYAIFGDGINGVIPTQGLDITGNYKTCAGSKGNLPPGSITNITGTFQLPNGASILATNQDYSSNGKDVQGLEDIRNVAPRSVRTLERAVTYQDYKDVAILCPGVGDAEVSYCCGKFVNVYVVPSSQGVATAALLSIVSDWFKTRKMITTKVTTIAAGISKMFLTATIFGKQFYTSDQILVEVINLLADNYGFAASSINEKPSVSDIISLIEGAKSVDHVDIGSLRVLPYVKPIETNTLKLDIDFSRLPQVNQKYTYTIIYKAISAQFKIFRGATPGGQVGLETPFDDGIVGFTIHSANYQDNMKWQFVTVPSYPEIFPVTTLDISDFTIPIFDIGPLVNSNIPRTIYSNLTVITATGTSSNCLPPCP